MAYDNPFEPPTLSGYNSQAPSDDGQRTAANTVRWSTHLTKIGNPLRNFAQALSAAVDAAFDLLPTRLGVPDWQLGPTPAEIAAGVTPTNYQYEPRPGIPLERYGGAVGSGNEAANATALTAAISVIGATGGTIQLGEGAYYFNTQISLADKRSITIRGVGGMSAGAAPATQLIYTGTASPWIDISGASGIFFEELHFDFNNASFTGTMVKIGNSGTADAFMCGMRRCMMGSSVGTGCRHLDLDKAIEFTAEKCFFQFGNPSVRGQDAGGASYSNVITFRDCTWYQWYSSPLIWGGESWLIEGCTFTPGATTGQALAFDYGSPSSIEMTWRNNWFGDVTASGGTWLFLKGRAITVEGNRFGGHATSTYAVALHGAEGFSVSNNDFDTFTGAINFATATNYGGKFKNNRHTTVTTFYATPSNAPTDLNCEYGINYPLTAPPSGAGPQTLTGAGAVNITQTVTLLVTTAADALTLADGTEGQSKRIVMKTDGGTGTLTPANLYNGTTITFDDVGDSADLLFTDGQWVFLGGTATLA